MTSDLPALFAQVDEALSLGEQYSLLIGFPKQPDNRFSEARAALRRIAEAQPHFHRGWKIDGNVLSLEDYQAILAALKEEK